MKQKLAGLMFLATAGFLASARADVVYSTMPVTMPPDTVYSWAFASESTSEFGGLIQFSPSTVNSASVLLSNFAYKSTYDPGGTSTGYNVPVTLKFYNVGEDNTVGSQISSTTSSVFVPWRPEPNGACGSQMAVDDPANTSNPYQASNGSCYSGAAVLAHFDLNNVALPGQVIYGVSFDTQSAGNNPTGEQGPYNQLNLAWTLDAPSAGLNPYPDTGYINTTIGEIYADGGIGGTGTFRQDQNYTLYQFCGEEVCSPGSFAGVIELTSTSATPEPGTVSTMLLGLAGLGWGAVRRRRRNPVA